MRIYEHDTLEYHGGFINGEFSDTANVKKPVLLERYRHRDREQFWFPLETVKKILAIDRWHQIPDSFFRELIRKSWIDTKDNTSLRNDSERFFLFVKDVIFDLSEKDFYMTNKPEYRAVQMEMNNIFINEAGFWHLANNFQWKIAKGLLDWLNKNCFVSLNLRINSEKGL